MQPSVYTSNDDEIIHGGGVVAPLDAEWGGPVLFFIAPPKSLETVKKSRGLRAARIESYLLHELHPIIIIFRVFTTPISPPPPPPLVF